MQLDIVTVQGAFYYLEERDIAESIILKWILKK